MDSFNTDGLILKVRHTGESDRIVTVLTRDRGVVNAFAKSARRPKSKLNSATQCFSYSDLTFVKKKDTYNITEASVKELFYKVNDDLKILSLSQYICQLAIELISPLDNNEENLRLILNSLYFLCNKTKDSRIIKAVTELRLASNCGYAPDLTGCSVCGIQNANTMYLNCGEGVLYCAKCGNFLSGIAVDPDLLNVMRHIVYGDFNQIYAIKYDKKLIDILSSVCEKFITIQTERTYSSLEFYKSLLFD